MNRVRAVGIAGLAGISVLVLAGCSATGHATTAQTAPAEQTAGAQLTAVSTGTLGTIVVDGRGMTLYRFDRDGHDPSVSNCSDACAENWPPVLVGAGELRLSGVDKSEVGTVTRSDGSRQLTIAGWPVYEYQLDRAPGDTRGEGVGGAWYAVTPTGQQAVPSGGGGY